MAGGPYEEAGSQHFPFSSSPPILGGRLVTQVCDVPALPAMSFYRY